MSKEKVLMNYYRAPLQPNDRFALSSMIPSFKLLQFILRRKNSLVSLGLQLIATRMVIDYNYKGTSLQLVMDLPWVPWFHPSSCRNLSWGGMLVLLHWDGNWLQHKSCSRRTLNASSRPFVFSWFELRAKLFINGLMISDRCNSSWILTNLYWHL